MDLFQSCRLSKSGMATFSTVVRWGKRWKSWKTKPTLFRRKVASAFSLSPQMSTSSTWTFPESGRRIPEIIDRSVVFPLPDGPTM